MLELSFALDVDERRLVYVTIDARLWIAGIAIHLPAALRPRVHAIEKIAEDGKDAVRMKVEVRWPCQRLFLAYDGLVDLSTDPNP